MAGAPAGRPKFMGNSDCAVAQLDTQRAAVFVAGAG